MSVATSYQTSLVYEVGQEAPMDYKGIEFSPTRSSPAAGDIGFQIGRAIKNGKKKTTLEHLAIRSCSRIDRN